MAPRRHRGHGLSAFPGSNLLPQILTATSRAGHIPHFCDNMHKYVLRRHLKGAVDAVIATKRMGSSRLMGLFASASETPTSVVETPAATTTEAAPAAAPAAATAS